MEDGGEDDGVHEGSVCADEESAERGGGGVPLTTTLPPKKGAMRGRAFIGSVKPTVIRMRARRIPIGIHRRISSAANGVGRFARRPSWKITGRGRMWPSCAPLSPENGGSRCS